MDEGFSNLTFHFNYSEADDINNTTSFGTDVLSNDVFWLNDSCRSFEFFLCTVVIGTLCLIGLFSNTISFIVLRNDRQNEVAIFLLQTLAVADNTVLVISFIVLSAILGPFQINDDTKRSLMYVIPYMKAYINPFGYITQSFSIWTTVLLAINRYVAVCRPFAAERLLTLRKAQVQVAVVIVLSVAFNVPRFFQYEISYRTNARNETYPQKKLTSLGRDTSLDIGYFNAFYTLVILVLPLVVLVVLDAIIIWDMNRSRRKKERESVHHITNHFERSITVVMVIIVVQLIVCHTPDRVLTVFKYIEIRKGANLVCPLAIVYASHFSNVLVILNSSTDFFIYCIFRQRFRMIFCARFCCFRGPLDQWNPGRRMSAFDPELMLLNRRGSIFGRRNSSGFTSLLSRQESLRTRSDSPSILQQLSRQESQRCRQDSPLKFLLGFTPSQDSDIPVTPFSAIPLLIRSTDSPVTPDYNTPLRNGDISVTPGSAIPLLIRSTDSPVTRDYNTLLRSGAITVTPRSVTPLLKRNTVSPLAPDCNTWLRNSDASVTSDYTVPLPIRNTDSPVTPDYNTPQRNGDISVTPRSAIPIEDSAITLLERNISSPVITPDYNTSLLNGDIPVTPVKFPLIRNGVQSSKVRFNTGLIPDLLRNGQS